MNFGKSRTNIIILFLAVMTLIPTVVFAAFESVNSSAPPIANRQTSANKLNFRNFPRRQNDAGNLKIGSEFAANNAKARFSNRKNPLLEISLAGNLDQTFGTGGKVTTQIGSSRSEALAIAMQTDGKFVAGGYSYNGPNLDFALVRYNADGSLDAAFGTGGKVTTDIGNADNASLGLAIQSDGKIVAGGSSFNGVDDDFAIVRYNSNGTLDATFGAGGIVTTDFGSSSDTIDAVTIQTDGKIVVVGYRLNGSFFDFALARYNSNGSLDQTFGTGGKVTTSFTDFDDLARAVALQTDGKIVVVGEADADFAAARYNSDGTLDTTFDGDGKTKISINLFDSAYDVAIQTDGKIVAAGETGDGNNSDFALIRYNSDGSLDTTFDGDGKVTTTIGAGDEFASSIAVQAGGKIIAGGFSFNGSNDDFALVRYNLNGSLDSTFGTNGKVTTDFGSSSFDYISALAIQSSNRIVAVGSANTNFAAAAYSIETTSCTYTLSPASADFPAAGGTGSFTISTQTGCAFAAVSNVSWIIIPGESGGSGSGTINFLVASNNSLARTGTISVGGQTFTVNQLIGAKTRKRVRLF